MGWNYTDKVKEHFLNPKNVGRIEDADGIGEVGSIACGDALSLTIKVNKESGVIEDARFQTFGCGSAIASSSILTEMVKGMTIEEALKITNQDIAAALGGLPAEKMHCSVMGREALEAAVANYRGEQLVAHTDEDEGRVICYCFGITDAKIRRVVAENSLKTLEDVTNYTKAGGGCGACKDEIESILEEIRGTVKEVPAPPKPEKKKLSNLQRIAMIQEILDNEVRPMLQRDDGDLELLDIDGATVAIRLTGHCTGCRASGMTTMWIEEKLREIIDPDIRVEVHEEGL
ncbi:MAG: Fe-S cluster assembly protein NifU [Myxococcota bacterium]|jgi:NifU-like protein|nr:Fe-S cluster assembly protein NifU [Myxococcota bacterium]